jgi:4-hydroxy-tetrahydrodipicolinate reductase
MKTSRLAKVVIMGADGKMGRTLMSLAQRDKNMKVVGAVEAPGNGALGQDIGLLIGGDPQGVKVTDSLASVIKNADAVIDFTAPQTTLKTLKKCLENRKPIVIGTTGFSPKDLAVIKRASRSIPIVMAPNMSLGVNLIFRLAFLLGATLGEDYDVEIIEAHHRHKKDAPSGTALELARQVAEGRKIDLSSYSVYGREGMTGARKRGTIGIHAIRGGDVVGEHTVSFMAEGERIELTHKATSREAFARGALFAVHYLRKRKPGLYNMRQVLAIEN